MFPTNSRQVLQYQLGALSLACPGLSTDDDTLVLPRPLHQGVAVVPDGEDVRGQLAYLPLPVQLDLLAGVDGQDLVRIHSHQDGPSKRLANKQIETFEIEIQILT